MRVLLIQPPTDNITITSLQDYPGIVKRFYNVTYKFHKMPPIGLLCIASCVRKMISSVDIEILDMVFDSLKGKMESFCPDIVGITVTTHTIYDACEVAKEVKRINPKAIVLFGGPHCGIYPEETLAYSFVDSIVIGEGERVFCDLIRDYKNKTLKDRYHGGIIEDLDSLPFPARDLVDNSRYVSILRAFKSKRLSTTIISSRGCPFFCTFCYQSSHHWRSRSAKNIVDELIECIKLGIEDFEFYDDTFTYDRQRVIDFCDEIEKRKLTLTFSIRTRVDCVDREMLIRLKKAGCKQINYGVESYQTEVLKILGKRVSGDLNKIVIEMTREIGISTLVYIILGSPNETIRQIRNTVNETVESDPDYVYIQALTPAPATAIYNLGLKKGLYEDYWRRLVLNPVSNCKMPVWAEFDTEVLNNEINRAVLMFYIRPKFIIRKLRELTTWKEFVELAKIFFNLLFGRKEYIGGS